MEKGLVIKNTGSWYVVKTEDGRQIECKIKGNFRLKGIRSTNPIAVGDRVRIVLNPEGTAFITEIEDHRNRRPQELHHPPGFEPLQAIAHHCRQPRLMHVSSDR